MYPAISSYFWQSQDTAFLSFLKDLFDYKFFKYVIGLGIDRLFRSVRFQITLLYINIPFSQFGTYSVREYPSIECKIPRPFIWDRDINNSFPKKRKYCCVDFTNCTLFQLTDLGDLNRDLNSGLEVRH